MKIRAGFVSNSSSSSFVVFTSAENFDAVLEKFKPCERQIIAQITGSAPTFNGIAMKSIGCMEGNYSSFEDNCPDFEEEDIEYLENEYGDEYGEYICHIVVYKFVKDLEENGDCLKHSENF